MMKLIASSEQRKFGDAKRDTLTAQCRSCGVLPLCNGGCPKDRFALSRDGESGQNYLCAGLELFFKHTQPSMQLMARLLQQGRAPSEVMALTAAEDKRRDPLQPCPCGSGRAFSHCHGDTVRGAGPDPPSSEADGEQTADVSSGTALPGLAPKPGGAVDLARLPTARGSPDS